MTAIRGYVPATDQPGLGVHSLDHFVLAVPDLAPAQRFYSDFGLDVDAAGDALGLKTAGHDQRWGVVVEGKRKKLHHLSFGCYSDDLPYLQERAEANGVALVDPPKGFESNGFWFQDPAGLLIEIKVAAKVSPAHKTPGTWSSSPEGVAGAPVRAKAPIVRPRRLSHVLVFTPDVDRSLAFYSNIVGLRLSDRSDRVAFMHAIHGSDHHILAFAQSSGPGLHHCSWDMSGIDDIGLGAMHMAGKGYSEGWGLGRHVLGSNYFHYVRDPWGSYAEYSCDIDYIPAEQNWQAGSHPPEELLLPVGPRAAGRLRAQRRAITVSHGRKRRVALAPELEPAPAPAAVYSPPPCGEGLGVGVVVIRAEKVRGRHCHESGQSDHARRCCTRCVRQLLPPPPTPPHNGRAIAYDRACPRGRRRPTPRV